MVKSSAYHEQSFYTITKAIIALCINGRFTWNPGVNKPKQFFSVQAIERLGGTALKEDCDALLNVNLDSSFKEIYINFIQQERRWAKTEEELELAVQRISVLEDEKKSVQGMQ